MTESLREQLAGTPLSGANAPYVEALYEQYLQNPASVDAAWRSYFDALPALAGAERAHSPVIAQVAARAQITAAAASPIRSTAPHMLSTRYANTIGMTQSAQMSIADLRATLTLLPW